MCGHCVTLGPLFSSVPSLAGCSHSPGSESCLGMSGRGRGRRRGGGRHGRSEGLGEREREETDKETHRGTRKQDRQSWCSAPLVGRGLLLCLPSPSSPPLPRPLSLSLCGRDKKAKPEGGPWRPSVKTGGCPQKWALLTSFLDKNHLALGELPRSVLVSYAHPVCTGPHVCVCVRMLTDGTCTPAQIRAVGYVPMGVHVCTRGPHECTGMCRSTREGTHVATVCSTWG